MANYTIRKGQISDMQMVEDAHKRSILELCSKDYTPEQIKSFSSVKYDYDIWVNSVTKDYFLVVEVDKKVEGMFHARYRDKELGEVVGLYFTPTVAGKGIGRKVFTQGISELKANGIKKVILTGTVTAKGFYEKMGFYVTKAKETTIRGAQIECFEMEMTL